MSYRSAPPFDTYYGRFLIHLDGSFRQRAPLPEPGPVQNGEKPTDRSKVAVEDIKEALTLLRSEDLFAQPEEHSRVVRQLIDVASEMDGADTFEPTGLAINRRDYMPITRRQMRQNWRYLRVPVREGPAVEFSARETLRKAARTGQFPDPVFVPRRVSRSEMVLLVDVHGSMSPFHELARRLTQTAVDGGRFRSVRTFYFHNAPDEYLMITPAFTDAISLSEFMAHAPSRWCSIVIVSDAGAARGSNNTVRVNDVSRFVQVLRRAAYRLAWLNPVPQSRWGGSSAGRISRLVPMFELSR